MIGIPRALFYYLYGEKWKYFMKELDIDYIISPETNKEILELGSKYASDEMCLSLKNYLGHIAYLSDKCDYILVPRIDNYSINDQTCTNFIALYDIVNNLFNNQIITYNIDYMNKETEELGFIKLAKYLNIKKRVAKKAYNMVTNLCDRLDAININNNLLKLNSPKIKVLLVGHAYNIYDNYIGKPIIDILNDEDIEIIDANLFDKKKANKLAYNYSKTLYWKYSKELIGVVDMCNIDGIVFLEAFPCGLDSLVNELMIRRINIPYIDIVIDEISSLSGFETRIESFIDLLKERKKNNDVSVSNDG